MNLVEIAGLAAAALGFAVTAAIVGRRLGAFGYWAWAWAVMIAAGVLLEAGAGWMPARATGGFLAVLFPGLQLAGAYEHVGRRVPRWLIPSFLVVASVRIATAGIGFESQSHLVVVGFEMAALLAAATTIHRSGGGHRLPPMEWLLIVGLLTLAVVEAVDAVLDIVARNPGVPWTVWLGIGIPVSGSQILVTFERIQHRLAVSLREREQALEALEESNDRFRAIAEQAHDLILEADSIEGIRYVNSKFYEALGYTPEEVLGRHVAEFAWDPSQFPSRSELVGRREHVFGPVMVRHRDGSPRWIESSARLYLRGDQQRIVLIARDVTERRDTDEKARKAKKLESLGLMAGGIAHDFNNLLTGILGNADIALSHLPADQPAREHVEKVVEDSERAAQLTRQLQAYTGSSPFEVRPVNVSEELRKRSELLHNAVGERVTLELDLANGLPAVEADPTQLGQVVLNLLLNAAEACGEGPGTVSVSTGLIEIASPPPIPATGTLEPGSYVFIEVADSGAGVDESIRDQLFDPFFTTKETGRGLGLSVVHGVVNMLRGAITVGCTADKGGLFCILLPTSHREIGAEPTPPRSLAGHGGVLVLDDDPSVLGFVRSALERYGYRVFTAGNRRRAEEIMADRGDEIALVLLDAVIPGESSETTLESLRDRRPDIPVLLMSGYAEAEVMTRFARSGDIAGFIPKPFRSAELAARMREVLDDVPSA